MARETVGTGYIYNIASDRCTSSTAVGPFATQYPAIDSNFADLLQGIILFSVLVSDFAATFRIAKKEAA